MPGVKERGDTDRRHLGTILESIEELPETTQGLSQLEREGVFHLIRMAVDAAMDVLAMLTKDQGRHVRDDHNLDVIEDLATVDAPSWGPVERSPP